MRPLAHTPSQTGVKRWMCATQQRRLRIVWALLVPRSKDSFLSFLSQATLRRTRRPCLAIAVTPPQDHA